MITLAMTQDQAMAIAAVVATFVMWYLSKRGGE